MTHKKKDLPPDLSPYDLVLIGHSHRYSETRQGSSLIVNPGSCGPRRFHQPITLARAVTTDKEIIVTRIDIAHPSRPPKIDPTDIAAQIEVVIKEEDEGRGAAKTSEKKGIDPVPTADRTGDPSIDRGTESKIKRNQRQIISGADFL